MDPSFFAPRSRRSFIAIVASEPLRTEVARALEKGGLVPAMAYDAVTAVRLGISSLCAAVVIAEPLEGTSIDDLLAVARSEGVRAPLVRMRLDPSAPIDGPSLLRKVAEALPKNRPVHGDP